MAAGEPKCFLCEPDERLVYMRNDQFFAMLGFGPLGEGYSLIATVGHVPSMLDLDGEDVPALVDFTSEVRGRLAGLFGPALVTEHGRVAACVAPVARRYEP